MADNVHEEGRSRKWDGVVLTASDAVQKAAFQMQLEMFPQLESYAHEYIVYEDEPEDVRIGSGGSTLLSLKRLSEQSGEAFASKRFLIIHSGGLSQRLSVASALGKVFLLLPGEKTMLEMKLLSYRALLCAMPPGVVIAASDTLEYIPPSIGGILPGEVTLFAHPSNISVAMQHGVYVMKDGSLQCVLQKPSMEELRSSGALKPNTELLEAEVRAELDGEEHALTDSFFVLSPAIALRLASLKKKEPLNCETCCYGDFLRALGNLPQLNYLHVSEPLGIWRQRFASIFRGLSCRVVVLPHNSFFHFGTPIEVMEHFRSGSAFCQRFEIPQQCGLYSRILKNSQLGESTYVQWSVFMNEVDVGNRSLLSDVKCSRLSKIPGEVLASTITFRRKNGELGYITAIFSIHDDLKGVKRPVQWFNQKFAEHTSQSLWTVPLFRACASMEESLEATVLAVETGQSTGELISMADALRQKDIVSMVNFRKTCLLAASDASHTVTS